MRGCGPCDPSSILGRGIKFFSLSDDKSVYSVPNEEKHTYTFTLHFANGTDFLEYIHLQNFSQSHTRHITSYFKKHLQNRRFNSPIELEKYINSKTAISSIIKTARVYLNYCEKYEKLPLEVINKYRHFLKSKQHKPDVYVPSDTEVIKNYNLIKRHSALNMVYLVLATSGIRYIECLQFLRNFDKNKFTINSKFVSYNVSELRHTKNVNNIYLPLFVFKQLKHVTNTYDALRQRLKDKKCTLSMKYLRKWHYNFLLYNNIPESVSDFIQGRVNKSIASNHYLAKSQQSSFWYGKIAHKFEALFKHNTKKCQNSVPRFRDTKKHNFKLKMDYSR